jgi:hypothetical protein
MAYRKRKKLKGLDPEGKEYWNEMLAREGLTMWEGLNPKLSYVGGSNQVEIVDGMLQSNLALGGKRVKPTGYGLDSDEKVL